MKKLLGIIASLGILIASCTSQPTPNINNARISAQTQMKTVNVRFSYYDPTKGGINCGDDCRYTAAGVKILDVKGRLISRYWWDGKKAGVACPPEYPFWTIFYVKMPDGLIELVCIDRGGAINIDNGVVRLDILHHDGVPEGSYNWPKTKEGYEINGNKTYSAEVKRPSEEIRSESLKHVRNNPTGRYCHSNYLEKLGRDPKIPEGMCPLEGWKSWCPYGNGKEDGMGQLVSIDIMTPQPGVNCYEK